MHITSFLNNIDLNQMQYVIAFIIKSLTHHLIVRYLMTDFTSHPPFSIYVAWSCEIAEYQDVQLAKLIFKPIQHPQGTLNAND